MVGTYTVYIVLNVLITELFVAGFPTLLGNQHIAKHCGMGGGDADDNITSLMYDFFLSVLRI